MAEQEPGHATDAAGRIPALEGLRAYLAWWVVAFHMLTTVWYHIPALPMPVALFGVGGHAVTVFMILSGFVIFRLCDLRHERYSQYIFRRFLRIYPVFIASGAASALFLVAISSIDPEGLVIWSIGTLERRLDVAAAALDNVPLHFLLNVVMLQGVPSDTLVPSASSAFHPVGWSLSLEWQFYLIAPALFLAWRLPVFGPALMALVIVAIYSISAVAGPHYFPSFLPISILWFALGMMSWPLYRDRRERGVLVMLAVAAILLSALALALCFTTIHGRPVVGARNVALPAAIWMVFLTLLIVRERTDGVVARVFRALFESPVALVLGQCSYSTYLWHRVILWLVMIGMAELLGSADPVTLIWASTPLIVPLVLVVSLLSYRYIEAPPIAFARRLTERFPARAEPVPRPG